MTTATVKRTRKRRRTSQAVADRPTSRLAASSLDKQSSLEKQGLLDKQTALDRPADVVDRLSDYIVERKLGPGDRLPSIRELASQFGAKTGVVRDALLDAQGKGIVKLLPRAGAFVRSVEQLGGATPPADPAAHRLRDLLARQDPNLFHLLDARETLELELIARSVRKRELPDLFPLRRILEEMSALPVDQRGSNFVRLDIQFHLEIARLSGNSVLTAMLGTLMEELQPHLQRLPWSSDRYERTDASHARLYSTLVSGDVDAARDEVRAHLRDAYNSLLAEMREPPSFETPVGPSRQGIPS